MTEKGMDNAIQARKDYQEFKALHGDTLNWKRVNSCQAWYAMFGGGYILKSYKTIVAYYSMVDKTYYIFGRYSATTYQHVRKFLYILMNLEDVQETVNLELENWFK